MNKIIKTISSRSNSLIYEKAAIAWLHANVGETLKQRGDCFPGCGSLPKYYDIWKIARPELTAEVIRLIGECEYQMSIYITYGQGWHYIETCTDIMSNACPPRIITTLIDDDLLAIQFKLACL
jgi:hypothetical protein